MNRGELTSWFERVLEQRRSLQRRSHGPGVAMGDYFDRAEAIQWLTEAQSALDAAFPPGHACRRQWEAALASDGKSRMARANSVSNVDAATGVFQSAHAQLKAGLMSTLADGVRVETEAELLDQADHLLASNYVAAAAVLAGGALESHLLNLCKRAGLTWKGDGAISKYNGAVGEARNAGKQIYSATESKMVDGWAALRNEAAHQPGKFARTDSEVRLMIEGIRQFLVRVP